GNSSWLNAKQTLQRAPGLNSEGLTGAVRYFDGFTNDARLVLDTLRSAARHGATLLNYCRFVDATRKGEMWECAITDALAGANASIQAKTIVNAAGPWADRLPHSRVKLRLAKGVHLVVDRARISTPATVVMTEGKRILFAIPWGERTILGTTDTDYTGSLDMIFADPADVRHILDVASRFFPGANLSEADVISSWAGVRPLIADPRGSPSDISRSHQIRNPESGWWDVAGGKLTTYRLMAEQTVDQIVHALRHQGPKREPTPCRTADEPLLPSAETSGISGILPPKFNPDIVRHFCDNEWAAHLDDVMVRRTSWHYYYKDVDSRASEAAAWMKEYLAWTDGMAAEEITRYHKLTGRDGPLRGHRA
ncbi:MAG: glycerol-3-phosphate dehydrogenase/oxidase, partial [Limisphaerales bacterium]